MDISAIMQTLQSMWVIWLIVLMAGVVWWAYRPRNKKRFEDDARIPFKDENGA